MNKYSRSYPIRVLFWILFTVVTCLILCWDSATKQSAIYNWLSQHFPLMKYYFAKWALLIFLFIIGIPKFHKAIRIQKINEQPSAVFYLCVGLMTEIFCVLVQAQLRAQFIIICPLFPGRHFVVEDSFLFVSITAIVMLACMFIYLRIKPPSHIQNVRFAPGAVGVDNDDLQFSKSAKNICEGLKNLQEYVSVVLLSGKIGFGKSSFARMIVDHFDQKKILYSYISLTETNEAKDFSKLFSERWFETLSERYPKINSSAMTTLMQSVLRESDRKGFWDKIITLLAKIDMPLIRTEAKVCDNKSSSDRACFVSDNIAKSFGNVPRFHEDLWLIIVDEIERSPLDEIFRLMEIVERFKYEGRMGLPLKIVFMLCTSSEFRMDLSRRAKARHAREHEHLINDFLFADPKSITQHLFLPPIDKAIRVNMIIKNINLFIERFGIQNDSLPEKFDEDISLGSVHDPKEEFLSEDKAIAWFVDRILSKQSPRVIMRCFQEMELFYNAYRNAAGIQRKDGIRFCDILVLAYIKMKYEYLIEFYGKTVDGFIDTGKSESEFIVQRMEISKIKDRKLRPFAWVAEVLNIKSTDLDDASIDDLIGLSAHFYIDFMKGRDETRLSIGQQDNTTSSPYRLKEYLLYLADYIEDPKKQLVEIYRKHKHGEDEIKGLDNSKLIEYSKFLRTVRK